ncbi:MAG: hypothetical protein CFE49_00180 [Pseudomonas sp. PGPPP3]|nr:MAG: hypothetical protein CFE49_00180 [Pseudomonas sp. PGPPP3]
MASVVLGQLQPPVLMAAKKTAKKAAKKAAKSPDAAAPKPAKKAAAKKAAKTVPKARPSTDEIAKAAYLNYRRRIENDLPGSHEGDWLEAERQLGAEE